MPDFRAGDIVQDTEVSLAAKAIGMVIPPMHWQECSNCGRLYPHEDGCPETVCAPCGLKWTIERIRAGADAPDVPDGCGQIGKVPNA